ncbi:glycosyl amidation-associated protein WbuZ [Magnetococcales bacterium HHB-1]
MLKTRIIPTLLWKNFGLVKGVAFDSWRRIGTLMPAVKVYNTRDVDELVLLDIMATKEQRNPDYQEIEALSEEMRIPFTVGGGIQTIEDIRQLLLFGADKVVINSAAYKNPQLIHNAADRFGSQCVVISIDAKKESDGSYQCYSHNGQQAEGISVADWAKTVEERGAGEILITSILKDGTLKGYDLSLIKEVSSQVKIPVIAAGGAGDYQHMAKAIIEAKASAVAAASMFHFTQKTPAKARDHLAKQGIPVRGYKMNS